MNVQALGNIVKGQDGAVFRNFLFRFDAEGNGTVYTMADGLAPLATFTLDKADILMPHSNVVTFGNAYFDEGDEFPLLYSNVYNSYYNCDDRMEGVTCVYRIWRSGHTFFSKLVQVIRVGFTDTPLWRSEGVDDVRPYGNFAIDGDRNLYYAFTMRDGDKTTRYFAFDLPQVTDGVHDDTLDARRVTLNESDITRQFDCPYHRFIQGACCHKGIIYSLEGFSNNEKAPPAIRLINTEKGEQTDLFLFSDCGLTIEPEMIDFQEDVCYYADHSGNLYQLQV